MPDQPNESKKLEIEDLLRLKRAERPDESFWNEFDRQLHRRMLQSLVKKDPWYLQVARGFSGRLAQSAAVAAAAAVLALMMIRPALITDESSAPAPAFAEESPSIAVPVPEAPREFAMADFERASREYRIEGISALDTDRKSQFRREFAMDTLQVGATESADYSSDVASAWPAIGNAGVASLVY